MLSCICNCYDFEEAQEAENGPYLTIQYIAMYLTQLGNFFNIQSHIAHH